MKSPMPVKKNQPLAKALLQPGQPDRPTRISASNFALKNFSLIVASATFVLATLASATQASTPLTKPDALLQIDLNRGAVIEKIVTNWSAELPAAQIASFKAKLAALRADHLLAANLSGSFDGVLEVLNNQTRPAKQIFNAANVALHIIDNAQVSDIQKALGDLDKDLVYTPITPCNLMDTRPGVSPAPPIAGPALVVGYAIRNIQVTGNCGVPAGAQAVSAQFTIENIPSAGGVIFAGKSGGTASSAVVSWSVPANYGSGASAIPLSAAGQMQLQSAGATHIKVDLNGYFAAPSGAIGDITEIQTTAGSGLTGGVTSGAANLALASTFKLPQTCANQQVAKFNTGSGLWECANDTVGTGGGTGTVTNIATGSGLTGGPITTTGTISLASTQLMPTTACAANQIPKWSGSAWACAADATSTGGAANAWVQGGNAFGTIGILSVTDGQTLRVETNGDNLIMSAGLGSARVRIQDVVVAGVSSPNILSGAAYNSVGLGVKGATIAGGGSANVAGGAQPDRHEVLADFGTVSGGKTNKVTGFGGVVAGGLRNSASGTSGAVGGGADNRALGEDSSVGGGRNNRAFGIGSVVAGGELNSAEGTNGTDRVVSAVGGGYQNTASAYSSVVSGGASNVASGFWSTVPGGFQNEAIGSTSFAAGYLAIATGRASFALGYRAKATRDGQFVWSDNRDFDFNPETLGAWGAPGLQANTFNVRATGGFYFVSGIGASGSPTSGCTLGSGGTGWACASDRAVKEGIHAIKPRQVLDRLLAMPVSTWSMIGTGVQQMGPMSQDFFKAFNLGKTDKAINSVDAQGVAFAAIQGLNQKLQSEVAKLAGDSKSKDAKISALEKKASEIDALKTELTAIKKKLGL